jgi:TPR repeat protein
MNNDAAQAKLGLMYEIGKGVPQDYVQAHMWFNLAASQSSSGVEPFPVATSGIESAFHEAAATARDRVAAKLTPEELAEAQRLAREWRGAAVTLILYERGLIEQRSQHDLAEN